MPLKKSNIFAAWLLLFLIVFICLANSVCLEISGNYSVQTDAEKNNRSVPNSLSAPTVPRACFLPDEKNFFHGRNDAYVLNSSICGIINLVVITVYLLYSSQVADKHTKRFAVLLI